MRERYLTALRENLCGTDYKKSYSQKKMAIGLQDKFDEVWLRYNKGKATLKEWDDALQKWISAELIGC